MIKADAEGLDAGACRGRPRRAETRGRLPLQNFQPLTRGPGRVNRRWIRLLFGDNQFFGVNHMSEEKARAQAMRFQTIDSIVDVLRTASDEGVSTFMCTTHDRIERNLRPGARRSGEPIPNLTFYPCMPYAHKYANAVTEDGPLGAMKRFLPSEGLLDAAMRGGMSLARKDVEGLGTLLVDAEMKMFRGLEDAR